MSDALRVEWALVKGYDEQLLHLAIKQRGLQEKFDFASLPPVVEKIGRRGRPKKSQIPELVS